jgi:catechol 2,3-dioxygenase-like lactoylglutathione lyase family enzyme
MIRGVKFVNIPVSDQDRALALYTEVLGFRLLTDQPFSYKQRWLEPGIPGAETRVVLFQFGDKFKPGGQLNITLWSDDVEATARELKQKEWSSYSNPNANIAGRPPYSRMLTETAWY